jgi:hypothetical protein
MSTEPTVRIRQALAEAVTDAMNKAGAGLGLPPIHWNSVAADGGMAAVSGHLGAGQSGDPAEWLAAAERWAAALGLRDRVTSGHGTVEWTGVVDGVRVEVWAVVDEVKFYGEPLSSATTEGNR